MEDFGLIGRTMDKAIPYIKNVPHTSTTNVEVDDVAQAFILLAIGSILALMILVVENIYWRWSQKRGKVKKSLKRRKELSFVK